MNQAFRLSALPLSNRLVAFVSISTLLISTASAQVNGPNSSPANLFDTVLNLPDNVLNFGGVVLNLPGDVADISDAPNQSIEAIAGQTTQLNILNGGALGSNFQIGSGVEVNFVGGTVGNSLNANSGSELNIGSGTVGRGLSANSNSMVNIDGGSVGDDFQALADSVVTISGGNVGKNFQAFLDSNVTISGGTFGKFGRIEGNIQLVGGHGRINGASERRPNGGGFFRGTISLEDGDILTCTLADGSPFALRTAGIFSTVTLTAAFVRAPDTTPIVINTPVDNRFSGLDGQTLTLEAGGALRDNFSMVNATLNVEGGFLGDDALTLGGRGGATSILPFSVVNISGGTVGSGFEALNSVVNISGGTVGSGFDARSGSEVNIFGSQFFIDGAPLNILVPGNPVSITDRDVTLSGLLADGEPFSFDLNQVDDFSQNDFFDPGATLTVTIGTPPPPPILGDVDQNGVVNLFDIAPFIEVLTSNDYLAEADCDLSGEVDLFDVAAFIAILTAG